MRGGSETAVGPGATQQLDGRGDAPPHPEPRIGSVILKLAAPCNLNCSYCYVYNHEDQAWRARPKFISDEVFDATLARLRAYCDRYDHELSITFHGGEPTLVGRERFDRLAQRARERMGERLSGLGLQTNGVLVDDDWIPVFQRHGIRPGISLDGPEHVHDAVRVDHAGKGSHAATVATLGRLRREGLEPFVLSVVNPGESGAEIYRYFRSLGVARLDLLLPDVNHDNKQRFYGRYGPTPVSDFLIPVVDAWLEEDDPDVRVRVLWDLYSALLGGRCNTDCFGNPPMSYVVIETDGAIEALDALRVCAEGIGVSGLNVREHGLEELARGSSLVYRMVYEGLPVPTACRSCPEVSICGGGFLPHRYSSERGFDNPSVWCADIQRLLAHMRTRLEESRVD